ncbi:hypothetical protein HYU19_03145 [Candidatus Woesearchaeota archaeon]|nr:hypothetical protein [Candidatus Woesearchaeota archaeon]
MRQALLYLAVATAFSSCPSSCGEYPLDRRSIAILGRGEYVCNGLVDGYSVIVEGQYKHAGVRVHLADPDNITGGESNDPRKKGVRDVRVEGNVSLADAVNLIYQCQVQLGHAPPPARHTLY